MAELIRKLGKVADEFGKAYAAVRADSEKLDRANAQATEAARNGGRKVIAPIVEVDGKKVAVVDDGATRKIINIS